MNRRTFLQTAGAAAAQTAFGKPTIQSGKRPNIVLIMADDMGFSDIGCYGSEIDTPNLNRLAKGGVRFTQFYNTARCCPTRASLLTGLYSHQAGIGHMVEDRGKPSYRGYLNDNCLTLAEVLRPAGYRTLMAGKWHVGQRRPHWPTDRGFDRYFGLISGGTNYFKLDKGTQMAIDDKPFTPEPGKFYMTDAIAEHAAKFVDDYARQDKPFFLYTAFTSPHWPLHALQADIDKYRGKYMKGWDALRRERHARMIELGIVDKKWPITPRDPQVPAWEDFRDKDDMDLRMAVYAAQIDRMDQGIGKILNSIKAAGAEDNTLVLFLADNGGCAEVVDKGVPGAKAGHIDSYLSYGLPWANASNTPFRLYKHWVHEGGIATPLIAHWPSAIKQANSITHQPGHIVDVMATFADVGGAQYPARYQGSPIHPLEGKSLRPILEGRKREGHETIFWEHEGNRAVRQGKWKLVARHENSWQLFDMEADRTEMKDLADAQPERVKQMSGAWERWADRCGVVKWGTIPKVYQY